MKKSKIAKIVLPLFLITAMLFCMTACGAKSAEKYIGVKFDGYDGFGSATVEIDTKAVKDDFNIDKIDKYFDKLKDEAKENDEDVYYELKQISLDKLQKKDPLNVFYDIEIEGENKNLKNGDQVTVTIDVSKTLDDLGISREDIEKGTGIKLPESKEFTVEGLEEIAKVDLLKDIDKCVEFEGANKHGTATLKMPDDFSTTSGSLTVSSYHYGSGTTLSLSIGEDGIGFVKLALDKTEDLNKGDIIKVSIDREDGETIVALANLMENGYAYETASKEITVPDLGDATELDILSKISQYVQYTGANGYGSAFISIPENTEIQEGGVFFKRSSYYKDSMDVVYDNNQLGRISFAVSADNDLKKDDKVYLTVKSNSTAIEQLNEKNMYLKEDEMEITVPDLGDYINSKGELTQTDIATIKDMAMKEAAAHHKNYTVKYEGMYFGTINANAATNNKAKGYIVVVYSYEGMGTSYQSVVYRDIHKTSDGSIMIDSVDGSKFIGFGSTLDLSKITEKFDSNYTYEKIG